MKRGPQKNLNKKLSITNMLIKIAEIFEITEPEVAEKRGRPKGISLRDCLMSAFAMFSLKYPSLLAFDDSLEEEIISHNLKKLYKIGKVPSDTYMRERIDKVDPQSLRGSFSTLLNDLQRSKALEQYNFLGGYLLAVDGTEIFNSKKISCNDCCTKEHRDGKRSYYHQILAGAIVHPNIKQVIPICPEPIAKQDGTIKNDCESNAMRRFLVDLKREHPKMKFTIILDALFSNAPMINLIKEFGYNFIINVKPSGNSALFEFVNGLQLPKIKITKGKNTYTFRYINKVPLNNTKNAPNVNFFECVVEEMVGKKKISKTFSWVTAHEITDDNIYELMRGGRARWKIENETFNTLKTQDYQFEHNFGHGKKHLHGALALIMMLAFLVDQIQELSCGLFQAALKKSKRKVRHWSRLRGFFSHYYINDWEVFYQILAFGLKKERSLTSADITNSS